MAKGVIGPLASSVWGSVGDVTFQRRGAESVIIKKPIPPTHTTPAAVAAKNAMRGAVATWNAAGPPFFSVVKAVIRANCRQWGISPFTYWATMCLRLTLGGQASALRSETQSGGFALREFVPQGPETLGIGWTARVAPGPGTFTVLSMSIQNLHLPSAKVVEVDQANVLDGGTAIDWNQSDAANWWVLCMPVVPHPTLSPIVQVDGHRSDWAGL